MADRRTSQEPRVISIGKSPKKEMILDSDASGYLLLLPTPITHCCQAVISTWPIVLNYFLKMEKSWAVTSGCLCLGHWPHSVVQKAEKGNILPLSTLVGEGWTLIPTYVGIPRKVRVFSYWSAKATDVSCTTLWSLSLCLGNRQRHILCLIRAWFLSAEFSLLIRPKWLFNAVVKPTKPGSCIWSSKKSEKEHFSGKDILSPWNAHKNHGN